MVILCTSLNWAISIECKNVYLLALKEIYIFRILLVFLFKINIVMAFYSETTLNLFLDNIMRFFPANVRKVWKEAVYGSRMCLEGGCVLEVTGSGRRLGLGVGCVWE